MKTVILSSGHSNTDPGAVYGGLKEADLNKKIVKTATDLLRGLGVGILNVPDGLNLQGTIGWINANAPKANLAVEVHVNAGGGTGVEGWYYHNSGTSKKVMDTILSSIVAQTGMSSRGSKDEYLNHWGRVGFVHDTKPLACLVECGFIDSKIDRKWLQTDNGLYSIGLGLAKGIAQYLVISWKENNTPIDPKAKAIADFKAALADSSFNCQSLRTLGKTLVTILSL